MYYAGICVTEFQAITIRRFEARRFLEPMELT